MHTCVFIGMLVTHISGITNWCLIITATATVTATANFAMRVLT